MSVPVEAAIWAALKARVQLLDTAIVPQSQIAWPKVAFTPPAGKPYIRVHHLPNQTERVTINTGKHHRPGILQLSLLVPNAGSWDHEQTLGQAGRIAAHLPADLKLNAYGVEVRISKAPSIAQALADGAYWHLPISVNYDCFA
jgi:hypothetical protein